MKTFIEVFSKKDYGDKKAAGIKSKLESVGLKNIDAVIPSVIYQIDGAFSKKEIAQIAQNLLTDPVLEESAVGIKKQKGYYKVQVWIRDSSTDVTGESVKAAIFVLGMKTPQSVRIGNAFLIKGKFTRKDLEAAVKKTYVNEMLNKYVIEG